MPNPIVILIGASLGACAAEFFAGNAHAAVWAGISSIAWTFVRYMQYTQQQRFNESPSGFRKEG